MCQGTQNSESEPAAGGKAEVHFFLLLEARRPRQFKMPEDSPFPASTALFERPEIVCPQCQKPKEQAIFYSQTNVPEIHGEIKLKCYLSNNNHFALAITIR